MSCFKDKSTHKQTRKIINDTKKTTQKYNFEKTMSNKINNDLLDAKEAVLRKRYRK